MKKLLCRIFGHKYYGVDIGGRYPYAELLSVCSRCDKKISVNAASCEDRNPWPVFEAKRKRY